MDIFRARVDMGTAILQRRNPLSPYNKLASIFQSRSSSANRQGIEGPLVLVSSQVLLEAFLVLKTRSTFSPFPFVRKRLIPSIDPYYPLYLADGFLILCRHLYEKGMPNAASFYAQPALYLSENMEILKENFYTS